MGWGVCQSFPSPQWWLKAAKQADDVLCCDGSLFSFLEVVRVGILARPRTASASCCV